MKLNDPTLLARRCLVGGAWVGEPVDPVDNPATGEILSPRAALRRRRRPTGAVEEAAARLPALVAARPPRSAR